VTVRLYMSDQGHVLDNEKHPVDKPVLCIPNVEPVEVWKEPTNAVRVTVQVYRAYTLSRP
jgi:hypothetical protein